MKVIKQILPYVVIILLLFSCGSKKKTVQRENQERCDLVIRNQDIRIDDLNRRCDSLAMFYRKEISTLQEDFNDRQITMYDYFIAILKKLFEETDYIYHQKKLKE